MMANETIEGRYRQGHKDAVVAIAGSGSHGWVDEAIR